MSYAVKLVAAATMLFISTAQVNAEIYFGDFHVHTTASADAFISNLPILNGDGPHTVKDACDFAQYCSEIDFFSLTDHAESSSPKKWKSIINRLNKCDGKINPRNGKSLTAFAGFEWTHVGEKAKNHYGHQNVVFKSLNSGDLPRSAISSEPLKSGIQTWSPSGKLILKTIFGDFKNLPIYMKFLAYQRKLKARKACTDDGSRPNKNGKCLEVAKTPRELIAKLKKTSSEFTVIPHGMSWGYYTPMGFDFNDQINSGQFDFDIQYLLEIYSGHGASETYRNFRSVTVNPKTKELTCPKPSSQFEPCCHRAGLLIKERCIDLHSQLCKTRITKAQKDYLAMGVAGHLAIPWSTSEDWKDCGVCRDCYSPAFHYRPKGAAQNILASAGRPKSKRFRFRRFGFIGSSDNHSARGGTGYKEIKRHFFTDTYGPRTKSLDEMIKGEKKPKGYESVRIPMDKLKKMSPFEILDINRQSSVYTTGGLIAVHASSNDRDQLWESIKNRNVYATSGVRMSLYFNITEGDTTLPMGSELTLKENPQFFVKAVGARIQKPGCPDNHPLSKKKQKSLCGGECFNPSSERHAIARIGVIKITPKISKGEYVGDLIEDPWKTIKCPKNAGLCSAHFTDALFIKGDRPSLYYVRAIQEKTPVIGVGGIKCSEVNCKKVTLCTGGHKTSKDDDCTALAGQRAWSSPIYIYN